MIRITREDLAPLPYEWAHTLYKVEDHRAMGGVNFRMGSLWRPDNRYPGTWMIRRYEPAGIEISFDALRHNGKPRPPLYIPHDQVDRFVLSLLEVKVYE